MTRYILPTVAAAILFAIAGAIVADFAAGRKLRRLEDENAALAARARAKSAEAESERRRAEQQEALNSFLNQRIAEIRKTAQEQDELIKELDKSINTARDARLRAQRVRAIAANADELCRRLAGLGYECRTQEDEK